MNHWPLRRDGRNIRPVNDEGAMKRLYQWISERASSFRSDTSDHGTSRRVRTEVTVERQMILLVDGTARAGFATCPLCGSKLAPAQAEPPGRCLPQGSISRETSPADSPPP